MKISGRTIAYLIILLAAFLVGGITFVGAQGFPLDPLPLPVEENGIVEIVRHGGATIYSGQGEDCPILTRPYDVPAGKRLIIEHATAHATNIRARRYRTPAWIEMISVSPPPNSAAMTHDIAFSGEGFPVAGGGPITFYADQGESVFFRVYCPHETGVSDAITVRASFTGRLVPYPHPSMIPTATPPP